MRLTKARRMVVIEACRLTRPDAALMRIAGHWVAVWHVEVDHVHGGTKVPPGERWRADVLVGMAGDAPVWSGTEHQARTRRAVLAAARAEVATW